MGRIEGKVAFITGAASGIGATTARRFASEGAAVVIADLNEEGANAVAREITDGGGRAVAVRCDVALEADVQAGIAKATSEFGRLDATFNNAGLGGAAGPIEDTKLDEWDRTMSVLLSSVFLGMKHSVAPMREVGGGSIISTASIAGIRGGASPHAYAAAKAAVINLTRSVSLELAAYQIRVNCICPGGINTPLISNRLGDAGQAGELLAMVQPLKRAGRPEDIAAMALYLASDEAVFVTGSAMVVDGGFTAGGSNLVPSGEVAKPCGPSFSTAISPTGIDRSTAAPSGPNRTRCIRSADSAPT